MINKQIESIEEGTLLLAVSLVFVMALMVSVMASHFGIINLILNSIYIVGFLSFLILSIREFEKAKKNDKEN